MDTSRTFRQVSNRDTNEEVFRDTTSNERGPGRRVGVNIICLIRITFLNTETPIDPSKPLTRLFFDSVLRKDEDDLF